MAAGGIMRGIWLKKTFKRVAKMSVQFNFMFVCGRCGGGGHLAAVGIIIVVVVSH